MSFDPSRVIHGIDPKSNAAFVFTEDKWQPPSSVAERIAVGRQLRKSLPRRMMGELHTHQRDPFGIIEKQNADRLPHLLPLRAERMSDSPFAFYRGTAGIMAADLASQTHSGVVIPSCGDAHIANFGFYASPQQTLLFDLNDFDEAAWAPWEWDLKRMITSVVIAGQASSRDQAIIESAVRTAVRVYALALESSARLSPRERYYTHFDAEAGAATMGKSSRKVLRKAVKHARKRTGDRAAKKLTWMDESGHLRFREAPPTLTRLEPESEALLQELVLRYLQTAGTDIQILMRQYTLSDAARRVVGVGSVGTRCALALLQDGDGNALILQSKEARRSVLEEFGGIAQPDELLEGVKRHGQGARVVGLQRVLQAVSDPFLGYVNVNGLELYIRQFHDMKGGIDAETVEDEPFVTYAQACAITLARAHSQSPLSSVISGYVGDGRSLGEALLIWAYAYAAISLSDYEAFRTANSIPS